MTAMEFKDDTNEHWNENIFEFTCNQHFKTTSDLPDVASVFNIWFMSVVESTTSSNTGTEPPTKPVLPPCGHTAILLSLQ